MAVNDTHSKVKADAAMTWPTGPLRTKQDAAAPAALSFSDEDH
jgi:hypothetical protein